MRVGSLDHLLLASLSSCLSSLASVARFSSVNGARFARGLASRAAFFNNTWVVVSKARLRFGSLDHLLLASLSSCLSSLACVARFSGVNGARFARGLA